MDRAPDRSAGFDFTAHMRRLCVDMTARMCELRHINMDRVALRYCQVRRQGRHGVQATLTPLRFEQGAVETTIRGRRYTIQRLVDPAGREMLYLLSFYLPRFLELPFEEKLATTIHELWHIGPRFDGDLRRHEGRCYAHGSSAEAYHAQMQSLARRYLALKPPAALHDFLDCNFRQLRARHGSVVGTRIATPKLICVDRQQAG